MSELTLVLATALVGWIAIGLYLFRVERRVRRMENELARRSKAKS